MGGIGRFLDHPRKKVGRDFAREQRHRLPVPIVLDSLGVVASGYGNVGVPPLAGYVPRPGVFRAGGSAVSNSVALNGYFPWLLH